MDGRYLSCFWLGAKDYTPEINASEIILDFQWHFPMDFQLHFPTEFHLSVVVSKGLSLVQWIFIGICHWIFRDILQWIFIVVISTSQQKKRKVPQPWPLGARQRKQALPVATCSQMPRHLVSGAHERINEIPTVPICYPVKPQPRERAWNSQRGKLCKPCSTPYRCLRKNTLPDKKTPWRKGGKGFLRKSGAPPMSAGAQEGCDDDNNNVNNNNNLCLKKNKKKKNKTNKKKKNNMYNNNDINIK